MISQCRHKKLSLSAHNYRPQNRPVSLLPSQSTQQAAGPRPREGLRIKLDDSHKVMPEAHLRPPHSVHIYACSAPIKYVRPKNYCVS